MPFLDLLEPRDRSAEIQQCIDHLNPDSPQDYRELAAYLVHIWRTRGLKTIGLGGGQGAGKTTLSRLIVESGAYYGEHIQILGLDDFYHTKETRNQLAKTVHPLLETRGPPGTHDIQLLINALTSLSDGKTFRVPIFNKGTDDREGSVVVEGGVDRIVIEGWCIGATPFPAEQLAEPVNSLERLEDADCAWRSHIRLALVEHYQKLNETMDCLAFLKVPSLDSVKAWRLEQERDRLPEQRMTAEQVDRFVQYYERITLWMLEDTTRTADIVVDLNTDHNIDKIDTRI